MAVIPTWSQARYQFGIGGATSNQLLGATNAALTYNVGPPATITRGAGSFVAEHHVAGMRPDIIGTVLNDGRYGPLATVVALTLTLDAADSLQAEGPIVSTVGSVYRDVDETEFWPSELHPTTDLIRSGGFTGGFTGIDKPYGGTTMTVTCNAGAADAVFGVADYHWYLSQRTDDPASQYLTCVQKADAGGSSYSGSVEIHRTGLAVTELGIAIIPTMAQNRELFNYVDLYCKRVSDGSIQWVNLYREMMQP
jgi:hypothetical protein